MPPSGLTTRGRGEASRRSQGTQPLQFPMQPLRAVGVNECMSSEAPVVACLHPPSFQTLVLESLPTLRRRAFSLTRHRADAEDLLQTAVASALAAQNSYEPGTNFKAWMTPPPAC